MKKLFSIGSLIILIPFLIGWYYYTGMSSISGIIILIIILITFSAIFLIPEKGEAVEVLYNSQYTSNSQTISKKIFYIWPLYTFISILFIGLIIGGAIVAYTILFPGNGEYSGEFETALVIWFLVIGIPIVSFGASIVIFLIVLLCYYTKICTQICKILKKYRYMIIICMTTAFLFAILIYGWYERTQEKRMEEIKDTAKQWRQEMKAEEIKK